MPEAVTLFPIPSERCVDNAPPLSTVQQQNILRAAWNEPASSDPLDKIAKGRKRAAILAGGLSLPAPYDLILTALTKMLGDSEIRPSRICMIACPGGTGPLLGRAAVRRYGDDFVGDHECKTWEDSDEGDPYYAASDLKIAIAPSLPLIGPKNLIPARFSADLYTQLTLGAKPQLDIVAAKCFGASAVPGALPLAKQDAESDVHIAASAGSDWEATLEEALLSVHYALATAKSATLVLAFSGADGLGSAHFTLDLWSLLEQAEEVLAQGGSLAGPDETPPTTFDPAATLARALGKYQHIVLLSSAMSEHAEGDELAERLAEFPQLSKRIHFVAREPALWELLRQCHGEVFRLSINPLGWRAYLAGR